MKKIACVALLLAGSSAANAAQTWAELSKSSYSWEDAYRYCSDMSRTTRQDWRIPSAYELTSRYKRNGRSPWNPNGSVVDWVWSSTLKDANAYWKVNANNGASAWHQHPAWVACVQGYGTDATAWVDTAMAAMKMKDWEVAKRTLEPYVRRDNPNALFLIAKLHFDGTGFPKSEAKAFSLYLRSAQLSHRIATISVASLYELGRGTPVNKKAAQFWYEKAASLGESGAAEAAERLRNSR
jgi:hypothetical protein